MEPPAVLVVAATSFELEWVPEEAAALVCGIGPVEAAASVAASLARRAPSAVLHVGIAGARRGGAAGLGEPVIGSGSVYADLAARFPGLVGRCEADAALLERVRRALPGAACARIATSAAVGGAAEAEVEAMEGFGVLRACALAGVPAIEVRTISNWIGEEDRSRWEIPRALRRLGEIGPELLLAVAPPGL